MTCPISRRRSGHQHAARVPRTHRARVSDVCGRCVRDGQRAREFSRTERLLIRFDAYAAGSEQVQPTAVMLNRAGSRMADVPVTAAQAGGTHQINLSLAAIPAGEYLIEITVKSASGEAQELVPFRVGS